jgi:pyruvate kinase
MSSKAQIIATIGPASEKPGVLEAMARGGMDVARFNFEWFNLAADGPRIDAVRAAAAACGRRVPIIADLPGPRVQLADGHSYDASRPFSVTPRDTEMLEFCAQKNIEYIAVSFVGSAADVLVYREAVRAHGGGQKLIAKIERKAAVDAADRIIAVADAVMIARGDLGREVPLEEIPFVQDRLIKKANAAGKPVIVATQMLLSMTEHAEPTRAEVTDVEEAVLHGADAVMLSEETASGRYPAEAVAMMERIAAAAERHAPTRELHPL